MAFLIFIRMPASLTFEWHGLSCFSIEARNGDAVAKLVTDPFGPEAGLKLPRNLSADIVAISHDDALHGNAEAVKQEGEDELLIIKTPGEFEENGLFVHGISGSPSVLYRFEAGDLSVGHLGDMKGDLTDAQREALEGVDILLIPVGDLDALGAKKAVEIVTELEPRIVIPMHYAIPGLKAKYDPVDKFLKEMGVSSPEKTAKFKAMKKDLPSEETKVVVLEAD
jgi:L-ascorbate metabolism protein UlaG (beta-lactamase superfamily)